MNLKQERFNVKEDEASLIAKVANGGPHAAEVEFPGSGSIGVLLSW